MNIYNMRHFQALADKHEEIGRKEMICEEYMMDDAEYVIAAFGAPAVTESTPSASFVRKVGKLV